MFVNIFVPLWNFSFKLIFIRNVVIWKWFVFMLSMHSYSIYSWCHILKCFPFVTLQNLNASSIVWWKFIEPSEFNSNIWNGIFSKAGRWNLEGGSICPHPPDFAKISCESCFVYNLVLLHASSDFLTFRWPCQRGEKYCGLQAYIEYLIFAIEDTE